MLSSAIPSDATLSAGYNRSYACLADAPCELDATIERQLARKLAQVGGGHARGALGTHQVVHVALRPLGVVEGPLLLAVRDRAGVDPLAAVALVVGARARLADLGQVRVGPRALAHAREVARHRVHLLAQPGAAHAAVHPLHRLVLHRRVEQLEARGRDRRAEGARRVVPAARCSGRCTCHRCTHSCRSAHTVVCAMSAAKSASPARNEQTELRVIHDNGTTATLTLYADKTWLF